MMQEVLKRRFWKVRRETEGEGANEGTPDRQADHDTDREAVQAALRGPNAGALMTAPAGNGRNENRKPKTEREARSGAVHHEYDESFQTMAELGIVDGRKRQVSAAHDAMRNLGVGQIPLAALAKRFEELYVKDVS